MKHFKMYSILSIVLVALVLGSLVIYYPGVFNLQQNTVLSVSPVNVQPEGGSFSDGRTGTFWTVAFTTDMTDTISAIKFDNTSSTANWQVGQPIPSSAIQVKIQPQQPYWTRSLNVQGLNVYPQTATYQQNKITQGATWTGQVVVPRLDVSVWTWGQSYWTVHIPFTLTVMKNGVQWAVKQCENSGQYDVSGISQTYNIISPSDSSQWVSLKIVCSLSGAYGPPALSDIIVLSPSIIYQYSDALMNAIKYSGGDYSYANYWFGGGNYYTAGGSVVKRVPSGISVNNVDVSGSPGFYTGNYPYTLGGSISPVNDREFPGGYRADDAGNFKVCPQAAGLFFDQQINGKTAYGLANYLNVVRGYSPYINQMNVYGSGWSITTSATADANGYAGYVKVMMPFGSMSTLDTLQISTKLADAIVEQPSVGIGKITSMFWLGQGDGVEQNIGDTSVLYVDVKQTSTVSGDISVFATATAGNNIFLNPDSQKIIGLAPGDTKEIAIQVLNNGAPSDQKGQVTITLKNDQGDITDTRSIAYTLLTKGVGNTQLTVYTQDGETNGLISGIPVTIGWGTNSQLLLSGSSGQGACNIDLQGYTGSVSVMSTATSTYQSANSTIDIGAGPNTLILTIYKIGVTPPTPFNWILILEIMGIIIGVAVLCGGGYWAVKKSSHRRKR